MQPRQSLLVLGNPLGSGAFRSVFEARWGCQQCAAKSFFNTQSDLYEREIQKEIAVLQKLRHRNIIQFYRTHKQDDRVYLIMELAEKGTLTKAINRGLLDWSAKTRLAHEIARGLEYIHQEGVLHRDLKSSNVLLSRHMEAKLADFGLARVHSTVSTSLSMSSAGGKIIGTLGWIAPEIFETSKPPYSTKSDVYALGMVMWEMAANCTRPYKEQDNGLMIALHVKSGGRETLPDDTPTEYREWRCWHQDPNQRPDASEIILVNSQEKESGDDDDDDVVPISLTFSNVESTLVDTENQPTTANHSNNHTASERVPQTDDDVVRYFCKEAQQGNMDAQLFLGWFYRHGGSDTMMNVEDSAWWYRKAAERGNATAQLKLGEMYENGEGVDKSDIEAVRWYRNAAVHGVAIAQVKLGVMYEEGRGLQQDDVEAVKWYRMAADQGQDDAQMKMATWYSLGRGVEQSDVEAVKWYAKAAEQGNTEAQYNLGVMNDHGYGVEQSEIEAIKWFTKAAENGSVEAQFNLGVSYEQGQGFDQSDVEAVKWYTKAAEQGYADAQLNLGVMYSRGQGVEQSDVEAVKWFTKAAEQGHTKAQYNLGVLYNLGQGVEQSDIEAVKWYTKTAEKGDASAQLNLGVMYSRGQGVEQNDVEAVKWHTKAAEQGNTNAKYNLGLMYEGGRGIEQSDVEAVKWYTKAAEQGNSHAQLNLALMYEEGRGVEQSDVEAIKWYTKAAEQGNIEAQNNLERMYDQGRGAEALAWEHLTVTLDIGTPCANAKRAFAQHEAVVETIQRAVREATDVKRRCQEIISMFLECVFSSGILLKNEDRELLNYLCPYPNTNITAKATRGARTTNKAKNSNIANDNSKHDRDDDDLFEVKLFVRRLHELGIFPSMAGPIAPTDKIMFPPTLLVRSVATQLPQQKQHVPPTVLLFDHTANTTIEELIWYRHLTNSGLFQKSPILQRELKNLIYDQSNNHYANAADQAFRAITQAEVIDDWLPTQPSSVNIEKFVANTPKESLMVRQHGKAGHAAAVKRVTLGEIKNHINGLRDKNFSPANYSEKGYSARYRRCKDTLLPDRLQLAIAGTDYYLTEVRNVVKNDADVYKY
ncbi:hypothetical protein BGW42_003455 [Actinomortierella wolfii]|nr:hypothetical protein BGW42_003455 [Actinomortierella wolfii]